MFWRFRARRRRPSAFRRFLRQSSDFFAVSGLGRSSGGALRAPSGGSRSARAERAASSGRGARIDSTHIGEAWGATGRPGKRGSAAGRIIFGMVRNFSWDFWGARFLFSYLYSYSSPVQRAQPMADPLCGASILAHGGHCVTHAHASANRVRVSILVIVS